MDFAYYCFISIAFTQQGSRTPQLFNILSQPDIAKGPLQLDLAIRLHPSISMPLQPYFLMSLQQLTRILPQ